MSLTSAKCFWTTSILCWTLTWSTSAHKYARPNIIFIMADDIGYNDIGYHAKNHNSDMKTPFLDAMAEHGIKLENYYVQPRCTPTRSQLLTGRYDIYTGLQHAVIRAAQPNAVPFDMKLLPEQLQNCGYDTHMVGKWHLGFYREEALPWNRGFRTYFGCLTGGGDHYTHISCKRVCGVDMWSSEEGPVNNTWGEYTAHLYARKAIEAVKRRDITKPFFLYLSYQSVHEPIQAPKEYIKPFKYIRNRRRRIYAGMVAALDESVMNVTSYLHEVGMLENTIVIFSTDNGGIFKLGGNNYPLRGGKATLWEGGMKAVGFVYGNPLGQRNVTHNGLLHISDWFPTLLRVASCPIMKNSQPMDGFDQWEAIRQEAPSVRSEILHSIDPKFRKIPRSLKYNSSVFDTSIQAAIRQGPWKLITGDPGDSYRTQPPEYKQQFSFGSLKKRRKDQNRKKLPDVQLFNIETDPNELAEISDKHPEIVKMLLQRLAEYKAVSVPVRFPRGDWRSHPVERAGFWGPWIEK